MKLFRFSDRKSVPYLLSPTHEEEITTLVGRTVKSYKELPLRLYQITRKYRDEFRPRHGLLRGREFTMKDLYTFDNSVESALDTYHKVRDVYAKIFCDMRLPVLSAKASSGDMGGDLSHEYHLPTPLGEDRVVSCDSCGHAVNEEIASPVLCEDASHGDSFHVWRGITKDRSKLVNVVYPMWTKPVAGGEVREYGSQDLNLSAVKSVVPDLDTSVEDVLPFWSAALDGTAREVVNVVDSRLWLSLHGHSEGPALGMPSWPAEINPPPAPLPVSSHHTAGQGSRPLNLLRIRTGDKCPECSSDTLRVDKAMELGHTFFLGTRYSKPLGAMVSMPQATQPLPMQMGCHGIGISRVVGAVAEHLADEVGLNWPASIAPYSCVVIPGKDADDGEAMQLCNHIIGCTGAANAVPDVVLDDRTRPLSWKLTDADLIGFPIIVLLGREWRSHKRVEVQCRRLGVKRAVDTADLSSVIGHLHSLL